METGHGSRLRSGTSTLGGDEMNGGTRLRGRRAVAIAAITGICLVAVSVIALAAASTDKPALTAADLNEMGELVRLWDESRFVPWPADAYGRTRYTKAEASASRKAYLDVVERVGTEEFQKHPMVDFDIVAFHEGYRVSPTDSVLMDYECTLLGTDFVKYDGGDVIVHVRMWVGCAEGYVPPRSTKVARVFREDWTPVWEARMRETDAGWKIAGLRTRWESEDLDPERYGPDTPHSTEYVPVEVSGEP